MIQRARRAMSIPILMFLIALILLGCATPTFRGPPQFQARVERLKAVAFIPPNVKVYRLTAGGVREEIDEWSAAAREHLMRAFEAHLTATAGFAVTSFQPEAVLPPPHAERAWTALDDAQALYKAVSASIRRHTYPLLHTFHYKLEAFDYTLGPQVQGLADQVKADALLFIDAVDHVSTSGRKVALALTMLLGGAAGSVYLGPLSGETVVSVSLVDGQTGDILWYNIHASAGGHDLRDPASCAELVQGLLKDFPGAPAAVPNRS